MRLAKSLRKSSLQQFKVLIPICPSSIYSGDESSVHQFGYKEEGFNLSDAGGWYAEMLPDILFIEGMLLIMLYG